MRIVAGTHRGRRIAAPAGRATRPTSDRVREAIFSIVGPVDGLDVLDLFAGSGALGLEALSRGAASATFVERSPRAVARIRANAGVARPRRTASRVVRARLAGRPGRRARGRAPLRVVPLDPPYSLTPRVVAGIGAALAPLMATAGTVVIEHSAALAAPEPSGLEIDSRIDRTYGDTAVSVLRLAASA